MTCTPHPSHPQQPHLLPLLDLPQAHYETITLILLLISPTATLVAIPCTPESVPFVAVKITQLPREMVSPESLAVLMDMAPK
jgi:hypothetical protein